MSSRSEPIRIHTHYLYSAERVERVLEQIAEPIEMTEGARREFDGVEGVFRLRKWSEQYQTGWWDQAK